MKLLNKVVVCLFTLLILPFSSALGQTNTATTNLSLGISEVSLLQASSSTISLQLSQQSAGLSIETSKSDSTARLKASSVITSTTRNLSAKVTSGTVPPGTILKLSAQTPNASFVGSPGILNAPVTLDNTDRTIVSNIATCYTGTGTTDGYPLKFTFALDTNTSSYANLRATTGAIITVTLTLSTAN